MKNKAYPLANSVDGVIIGGERYIKLSVVLDCIKIIKERDLDFAMTGEFAIDEIHRLILTKGGEQE